MEKYINTDRTTLSKIKRWIVGCLPRKFHCFVVGAEKTGTTSLHSMLKNNFRSGHEVDPQQTLQLAIDYQKGTLTKEQAGNILINRDQLLNLEMESAHHFAYICDILVEIFPIAKFIITIREPYSHLESRLNWNKTQSHPAWRNYINFFIEREHLGYEKEEILLREKNLYSLDTYLKQYADHYKRVLNTIPIEKRIIIKTNELNYSTEKIAHFLDIDSRKIIIAHSKKNTGKERILDNLDQSFVRNKIWHNCKEIIKEYFPETKHLYSIDN